METLHAIHHALEEISRQLKNIESKLAEVPAPKSEKPEWLDPWEICKMLHITKRTLDNYRDRGYLTYSKVGGRVFYYRGDIDDFLKEHRTRKEPSL